MTIDLFGRGYSDCPTKPLHNLQLYTTQILLALASSPVSWTGSGTTFTMVGYSLGGGIGAAFASYFPSLVSHMVLVASSGLVRQDRISFRSRVLYGTEGWLPESFIRWAVGKRLGKGQTIVSKIPSKTKADSKRKMATGQKMRERDGMVGDDPDLDDESRGQAGSICAPNSKPILGSKYPSSTEAGIMSWQLDNCKGFIPAFISGIRNAPIHGQHERFRILGRAFEGYNEKSERKKKALLVVGSKDPIILEHEVVPDMQGCLGERNLEVLVLHSGHEVPISHGSEIADAILELWKNTGW